MATRANVKTDFDPSRIIALNGPAHSPNLRKWLAKECGRRSYRPIPNVFRDGDGTLYIGWVDDPDDCGGRGFTGSRIMSCLTFGAKAETWYFEGKAKDLTPIADFWPQYVAVGRCAIDPAHSIPFNWNDDRWKIEGDTRDCRWCGNCRQMLHRWTEVVQRERWVAQGIEAATAGETTKEVRDADS